MAKTNRPPVAGFTPGQSGEDADLHRRIRAADDPRAVALERCRSALGIAQHNHDEIRKAHSILKSADSDGADILAPTLRAHEENLARAEIAWARAVAQAAATLTPDTKSIEHAERAILLAGQEIERRKQESPSSGE